MIWRRKKGPWGAPHHAASRLSSARGAQMEGTSAPQSAGAAEGRGGEREHRRDHNSRLLNGYVRASAHPHAHAPNVDVTSQARGGLGSVQDRASFACTQARVRASVRAAQRQPPQNATHINARCTLHETSPTATNAASARPVSPIAPRWLAPLARQLLHAASAFLVFTASTPAAVEPDLWRRGRAQACQRAAERPTAALARHAARVREHA